MIRSFCPRLVLFFTILLLTSLACQTITDLVVDDSEPYLPEFHPSVEPKIEPSTEKPPQEMPSTGALICPEVTKNILESAAESNQEEIEDENSEEPEQQYIVSYHVSGNQISDPYFENVSSDLSAYQQDETSHQKVWNYFTTLIPLRERESVLIEFALMTDGKDNALAAVAQTYDDPEKWGLEVDIADSDDTLNLTYTLIHEYAHLLTLGPDQVTPSLAIFNNPEDEDVYFNEASACQQYFPGEGCSRENAYINAYFDEFWADIYDEWQNINLIEDEDEYYTAFDDFYYDYEDSFVTGYAATNPEEDIAEAFTFFVLSPRPGGNNTAEKKILFFYAYPELVQLRNEIISGICRLNQ